MSNKAIFMVKYAGWPIPNKCFYFSQFLKIYRWINVAIVIVVAIATIAVAIAMASMFGCSARPGFVASQHGSATVIDIAIAIAIAIV